MRILTYVAAAILAATAALAVAQEYPVKPIRLIVPTPPGSGPDVDARHIAARVGPLLGQNIIVENRPGAATRIAIEAVVKSPADGYTLLLGTPSLTTAHSLYANLPFDTRRDLTPVSLLSTTAYALTVNAQVPAQNLAGYIAQARANPAHANIATYGIGTIPHLAGAWFASLTGADLKFIHYNTQPPFPDLLAGQTAGIFDALLPVIAHAKAGKLRVLAISGKARQALLPEVPTFAESGQGAFDPLVWVGVMAPAGTPAAIVNRVASAFGQVAKTPEVIAYRRDVGSDSVGSAPAEFGSFLEAERSKWGAVIQRIGLKLE
jgi:tripartite-type tricarboxylate transporter receptor subunit TctC